MVTTHHCPKQKKGGCRKPFKTPIRHKLYCPEHQTYCPGEGCEERVHLKTEGCVKCIGRQQAEERKRKEEERKRKEKEEKEKEAAALAQSIRDKNNKNKQQKK
jgi:hypothetical protein